jgi:hypothetical protein
MLVNSTVEAPPDPTVTVAIDSKEEALAIEF